MKGNTIKYFISDAFKNLKRNRTLTAASIATVAVTLLILGVFILTSLGINSGIYDLQSKVEVQVFLKDNITKEQSADVKNKVEAIKGVKEVTFKTKEEALKDFKETLGENKDLLEGLDSENPLPNSYVVKVSNLEVIDNIVKKAKDLPGVEKVENGKKAVKNIRTFVNVVRWTGIALFIILIGVSLFLIGNTIKLTVYARRKEIGIMKYVGATDWFIRWPFVIEGVIMGFVGSIISVVVLYYAYKFAYYKVTEAFVLIKLTSPSYVLQMLSWQFGIAGIVIGAIASIIVIRKFLKV